MVVSSTNDGRSSERVHIKPIMKAMSRRMEEGEGLQKSLLLWRIKY